MMMTRREGWVYLDEGRVVADKMRQDSGRAAMSMYK
jgi:hypothetical protein